MADDTPFFVVGAGRSGTTLLRLMLTGHPRLHIPPETWFLRPLVQKFPLQAALTQEQAARAVELMVGHERWDDLEVSAAALRAAAADLAQPTLRELINIVFDLLRASSGKPRIGDKTPHYFAILPALAELYPSAKFIHVLRDGRDVAISWIDAGWQRYYEAGFEWPAAVDAWQQQRAASPTHVLLVRHEELIRDPEAVLRTICAFLDETYEPAMLAWQDRIPQVAQRDRHLHDRLRQPLSDVPIGIWRTRLTRGELFAMEACLHRPLRQTGYELRYAKGTWQPLLFATAALLRPAAPLLRRVAPWLSQRGWLRNGCYF